MSHKKSRVYANEVDGNSDNAGSGNDNFQAVLPLLLQRIIIISISTINTAISNMLIIIAIIL